MAPRTDAELAGPGTMLFSAALFGLFGFAIQWSAAGTNGQYLLYVDLFKWTLRISAVLFALAGGLTMSQRVPGNLLYAVVGLAGAVMMVVVGAMDQLDPQHTLFSYAPIVLLLFALWNGYGSWTALRGLLAIRRQS